VGRMLGHRQSSGSHAENSGDVKHELRLGGHGFLCGRSFYDSH
jgi:hypothetical protein